MKITSLSATAVALVLMAGKCQAQSTALMQPIKMTDNEQFEKATSVFKTLVAKDPANAETWFYFGENLFAAEKRDSAEVLYKKGIEVNPKMPLNHIGLAKIYRVRDKNSEAQASLDAAWNLFNEKGVKIKDEMKVRAYVEGAEAWLEGTSKNPSKSLELVAKALALDENNVAAYIVKGDALFESNKLNATDPINAYKKAAELDPKSAKATARIGFMYYRAKQFDRSITNYNAAMGIEPNYAPAYRGRGDANVLNGKIEEGLKDYAKYLEMNKGSISARISYAGILFVAKKYAESLNEITEIEKVSGGTEPRVMRLKGYDLYELGKCAEALEIMNKFMEVCPKDKITPTDYEYLSRIHGKCGSEEKRDENIEKAIMMDHANKLGLIDEIIAIYKEKKNYAKQVEWFKKRRAAGSKDVNDYFFMGQAAYNIDSCKIVEYAWTEYSKEMPDYAPAYYYVGWGQDCLDKLDVKTWVAKTAYETFVAKVKPEEVAKMNKKLAEAYFFLARYYYYSDKKDVGMSRCYLDKVITLNASEQWNAAAAELMKVKEIASATPAAECK
ncbi:MAG TPA: tetratricopeptide repeat protein [Flavobacteriales bacterium]|nr:tetratricopeptide repeat protein [Flavobacteriales bacterium]